ncbi:MAG: hypothetical protein RL685_3836 [Pseudomonadota bacterium]|jgi:hypothetical protein
MPTEGAANRGLNAIDPSGAAAPVAQVTRLARTPKALPHCSRSARTLLVET